MEKFIGYVMTKQEQVKAIFIEEAGEIIENDIKMENPEDLHAKMMNLLIRKDVQRDEVNKWMEKAGISSLHEFNKEQREKIISMLEKRNDT